MGLKVNKNSISHFSQQEQVQETNITVIDSYNTNSFELEMNGSAQIVVSNMPNSDYLKKQSSSINYLGTEIAYTSSYTYHGAPLEGVSGSVEITHFLISGTNLKTFLEHLKDGTKKVVSAPVTQGSEYSWLELSYNEGTKLLQLTLVFVHRNGTEYRKSISSWNFDCTIPDGGPFTIDNAVVAKDLHVSGRIYVEEL